MRQDPVGHRCVRSLDQVAQPLAEAEVGVAGEHPSRFGVVTGTDPSGDGDAEAGHARRPQGPRREFDPHSVQLGTGRGHGGIGHAGGVPRPGAAVTAATGRRRRIVERPLQERHPALRGLLIGPHQLLLAPARVGDPSVALGVVRPRQAGGCPAAADPGDRAVHVEHLQQQFQAGPADVDDRLQCADRQWTVGPGERVEHGPGDALVRHRGGREVVPDVPVSRRGQQQDVGAGDRASGPAHLLVVGHR